MRIYLCGPISLNGTCTKTQVRAYKSVFIYHEHRLTKLGHEVLNPCSIKIRGGTWTDYMKRTIMMLCASDIVLCLPDFEKSRGAVLEIHLAHELKIHVNKVGEV